MNIVNMIIFKSIYTAFFFVVLSFLLSTPISLVFGEEEEFMGVVNMEPAIYPIPPGNYNATGCDGSYFMYNETECIVALDGSIVLKTENTIDIGPDNFYHNYSDFDFYRYLEIKEKNN